MAVAERVSPDRTRLTGQLAWASAADRCSRKRRRVGL